MSTLTLNPYAAGGLDAWDRIQIAGVDFKGKVEVSGEGLKKKNDHRSSRGRNGGRSVATGNDLVTFKVLLGCFEESHFLQLDAILQRLTNRQPSRQDSHAFEIFYPSLEQMEIRLVLVDEISLMEPTGPGGLFTQEIKFKEFRPAPPRQRTQPVTRAPTTPAQGQTPTAPSITPIATGSPRTRPDGQPLVTMRPIPPPSQSGGSNP